MLDEIWDAHDIRAEIQREEDSLRWHTETQSEEDMTTTPSLNAALVAARKEIANPHFDSSNPHFRSRFASLKAVIDATVKVAAEHGIAVIQDLKEAEGGIRCYTHLCHESGEEKSFGPLFMPSTKSDAQGLGSAATYCRRYQLQSIFSVTGDADDDGNAASESAFTSVQARSKVRNAILKGLKEGDDEAVVESWGPLDNDQKAELWSLLNKAQQVQLKEARERYSTDQTIKPELEDETPA